MAMSTSKSVGTLSEEEQAFLDSSLRVEANNEAHNELVLYQHTGDGRCIWRAISVLFEAGIPIPANLHAKLHEWSTRLGNASNNEEIAKALEFEGHDKKHIGAKLTNKAYARIRLASEVRHVKELYRIDHRQALEVVARNRNVSFESVRRNYYRVFGGSKRKASTPVPDLMKAWK